MLEDLPQPFEAKSLLHRREWVSERVNVLGVGVSAINMQMLLTALESWVAERTPHYVCVTGVHGVMESRRDPQLRAIHNGADLVTPDGMPLVWISRGRGHRHVERVYGPDILSAVCAASPPAGYRHFFYGGGEGVAELLAAKLRERFPDLQVAGTYTPPFRPLTPEEDAELVRTINRADPDIVWVGLSTPKQERWMAEHVDRLSAAALIGVGAAFDFHAGLKKQAPRWVQRNGLEWLFRLAMEPRRLWKRNLHIIPGFIWLYGLQHLGLTRYPSATPPDPRS